MIDSVDNIADLHEELLIFLLDYKEHNQSDLTFMLRSADDKYDREALEKGWWFKGNDKFVNVYFLENTSGHYHQNNIQLSISSLGKISIRLNFKKFNSENLIPIIKNHFRFANKFDIEIRRIENYTIHPQNNYYKESLSLCLDSIYNFISDDFFLHQNIVHKIKQHEFKINIKYIYFLREKNKRSNICINSLSVQNYFSVKKTTIQNIPNKTKWIFLTGQNGAGKTLILQALTIGLFGENERIILLQNKKTEIEVNYQSINTIRNVNYNNSTKYLDFFQPLKNIVCYGPFRLDIQNEASENEDSKRSSSTYGLFGEYDMLLKNIETELKFAFYENKTKFEHLIKMLKQVIPTLHDVEFDAKNRKIYYYEKNELNENEIYEKVNYSELATGVKSIIAMVGDIYIRFSKNQLTNEFLPPKDLYGIVIIDELDLHLHPKWQKNLPSLLSDVFPNIQFIASTHSAIPILGAPENSVLLRVNRNKEEGITVERLEHLEQQLQNLTPNLILTSEIFGLQDIFPITHDESKRIQTENTMNELQENEEMMATLKSYMNTDKEDELLEMLSK